jgi:CBS domain containing-hemolysin-like protein
MEIEIGIVVLLLALLTFLAIVDMAFGQLSDVGLSRLKAEAESRPETDAGFLTEILENRPRFRFTISAAVQICLVAFSALTTFAASKWFSGHKFLFAGAFASLLLAGVFRQFIPRWVTLRNPEGVLLKTLPLVRPFYRLLTFAADPFHRKFDRMRAENETVAPNLETVETKADDDEQLQAYLEVGEAEGIIEEDESELIYSIIEFGDTRVHEIMTPRTDIVALPVTANVREARDVMIESKYSRLPVYKEKIDDIEGFVYMRDLLESWADGHENDPIAPRLRPLYFVPETKPVADLLEEMQKAHTQIAMVVDEYGGVAGLVTIEDMLEEIVGEIEDEDIEEEETNEIVEVGAGVYDVQASAEIGKVEDLFDLEIETDDFTTIAGLVINDLGRVPAVGEKVTLRGLDLEVREADEKRIGLLRVQREAETAQDDAA